MKKRIGIILYTALCLVIGIILGISLTISSVFYIFFRIQTPHHLSVVPMSKNKVINCFYEYETEIVDITNQLQNDPTEDLEWYYLFPDEVKKGKGWDRSVWYLEKDSDFHKNIQILKNEGFVSIDKSSEYIMFERWSSGTRTKGIIYSETDPEEFFTSEEYRDLELKETERENFYYISYYYAWD